MTQNIVKFEFNINADEACERDDHPHSCLECYYLDECVMGMFYEALE